MGADQYSIPWLFNEIDELDLLFARDAYRNGLEENRHVVETFCRYLLEQNLVKNKININDHFIPVMGEK